jgi:hypothetical protein
LIEVLRGQAESRIFEVAVRGGRKIEDRDDGISLGVFESREACAHFHVLGRVEANPQAGRESRLGWYTESGAGQNGPGREDEYRVAAEHALRTPKDAEPEVCLAGPACGGNGPITIDEPVTPQARDFVTD